MRDLSRNWFQRVRGEAGLWGRFGKEIIIKKKKNSCTFAVKYCIYWGFTGGWSTLRRQQHLGLNHCSRFLQDCSEGKQNLSPSSCKPCRWIDWKIKSKGENRGCRLQLFCSGEPQSKALSEEIISAVRSTPCFLFQRERYVCSTLTCSLLPHAEPNVSDLKHLEICFKWQSSTCQGPSNLHVFK